MNKEKIAVILAAGVGSRLHPLTAFKPKCMVRVAGIPILEHQIRAYEAAGFHKIYIVTGFRSNIIQDWLLTRKGSISLVCIENIQFESTNNMYSLWLTKEELFEKEFYLSNGDVVFDKEILNTLVTVENNRSVIPVDVGQFIEESMKIVVDQSSERIIGISKGYKKKESIGVSIDLYRFSASASKSIFTIIDNFILKGECCQWTEIALDMLLKQEDHDFYLVDIQNRAWQEIDNLEDLARADILFCATREAIASARAFVFDIDGTLTIGGQAVPGALDIIKNLQVNRRVFFCTNNSSRSREQHAHALRELGFDCSSDDIMSSTLTTISYLRAHKLRKLFVIGTEVLSMELESEGFECKDCNPEIIVVGFDTTLTYEKIAKASLLISAGKPYILTHPDPSCPTLKGPIPDAGGIGALLHAVTGKEPQAILGKPSSSMLEPVLIKESFCPEEVVIIGDRLLTDISMAINCGCLSALVLSGITKRQDVESETVFPSVILDTVRDLEKILFTADSILYT